MYRGLIDTLAFTYSFICKGRGKIDKDGMNALAAGAHTMVGCAPDVLGREDVDQAAQAEGKKDLKEAAQMAQHIDEMVVFLQSLEIV